MELVQMAIDGQVEKVAQNIIIAVTTYRCQCLLPSSCLVTASICTIANDEETVWPKLAIPQSIGLFEVDLVRLVRCRFASRLLASLPACKIVKPLLKPLVEGDWYTSATLGKVSCFLILLNNQNHNQTFSQHLQSLCLHDSMSFTYGTPREASCLRSNPKA